MYKFIGHVGKVGSLSVALLQIAVRMKMLTNILSSVLRPKGAAGQVSVCPGTCSILGQWYTCCHAPGDCHGGAGEY
ncbi:hypothetical protein E2C01_060733 [Portunus trituberculatus]|uniref:Uncharacterized protein n=1 Tax=Portunus trituberculatus TaxID=210409 RepID=A0A5B7HCY9_PORTR|nr:hypothetical protein [Portunus trituberculatus]